MKAIKKLNRFNKYSLAIILISAVLFSSCKKDWLDAKPSLALIVPQNVADYQALMDNTSNLFNTHQPALGELASDSFYLPYSNWNTLTDIEKNTYIWAKYPYGGISVTDWDDPYKEILNANIVLDGINKVIVTTSNTQAWNNVKGSALFFRAFNYYNMTQLFCKTYDKNTASSDLGLPLKLTPDLTQKTQRSTLKDTYTQIISDLSNSKNLLPVTPLYLTRPSKPAVYGLLARIYLSMEDYQHSLLYADSALQLSNQLLDFNSLDPGSNYPIQVFTNEVTFHSLLLFYRAFYPPIQRADSTLCSLYGSNDLRGVVYMKNYAGANRVWGNFAGSLNPPAFGGLANSEIYLIRSESEARLGDIGSGMKDLNTLLKTRYKTGTYFDQTATDETSALTIILTERRKELVFRGLRWSDLRRLNKDPRFAVTLIRILNGQTYTLGPNDSRYVFPIPPDEIRLSGIQQNP